MKSQARIFCGDFPKKRVIKNNRVVKYRTDFLHLKRNCIKRNAKVVNFETDKQKSMNELKKIIRLFKLTSRSKEKCAQTLLESEQYDV